MAYEYGWTGGHHHLFAGAREEKNSSRDCADVEAVLIPDDEKTVALELHHQHHEPLNFAGILREPSVATASPDI